MLDIQPCCSCSSVICYIMSLVYIAFAEQINDDDDDDVDVY